MRPGEALSEPMEKDAFLDYELMIYIREGTEAEELEWFQVINIASELLSAQELRNAIYSGTWLTSAKEYFSKPNSGGKKIGDKYLTADWNRQGGLEVALKWVSHDDIIGYMSEHAGTEEDGTPLYENAEDLYNKFEEIIKRLLGCVFLAEIDADGVGELLLCLAVKGVASVLVGFSGIGVEGTAEINELVLWRHINTAGVEHVKFKVEVPADDALGIAGESRYLGRRSVYRPDLVIAENGSRADVGRIVCLLIPFQAR